MALPSISDIARLTADPELRNTPGGKPVAKARLAFNEAKFNRETRQWEDGATFYVDAELWEDQAERFAGNLRKGDDVHVVGDLKTDSWEKDGARQSKPVLRVRRFKAIPRQQPTGAPQGSSATQGATGGGFGAQNTAQGGWGTNGQTGFVGFESPGDAPF